MAKMAERYDEQPLAIHVVDINGVSRELARCTDDALAFTLRTLHEEGQVTSMDDLGVLDLESCFCSSALTPRPCSEGKCLMSAPDWDPFDARFDPDPDFYPFYWEEPRMDEPTPDDERTSDYWVGWMRATLRYIAEGPEREARERAASALEEFDDSKIGRAMAIALGRVK